MAGELPGGQAASLPVPGSEDPRVVAVVTGAAAGIGRASAIRLARDGYAVLCCDLDERGAGATAHEIRRSGGHAEAFAMDVADDNMCAAAVSAAARLGQVRLVCNIAGISPPAGGVLTLDPGSWDRIMAVNVRSIYSMTRHVVPFMRPNAGGVIVNVASVHAFAAQPASAAYAASKGAVVSLTRQLAVDLTKFGIRVVAIAPGAVNTGMSGGGQGFVDDPRALGRIAAVSEIAEVIAWTASRQASFVNGTTIIADGGLLAPLGVSQLHHVESEH